MILYSLSKDEDETEAKEESDDNYGLLSKK